LKTRLKKTRQNKKIERGRDSIQSERALGGKPNSILGDEKCSG
jgi:hypothetical protein